MPMAGVLNKLTNQPRQQVQTAVGDAASGHVDIKQCKRSSTTDSIIAQNVSAAIPQLLQHMKHRCAAERAHP